MSAASAERKSRLQCFVQAAVRHACVMTDENNEQFCIWPNCTAAVCGRRAGTVKHGIQGFLSAIAAEEKTP